MWEETYLEESEMNSLLKFLRLMEKHVRKHRPSTCETCKWRDYGTDSHYVCYKRNRLRVNRKRPSCVIYVKKK